MTATDIAVALGRGTLGYNPQISHAVAERAGAIIDAMLADAVDRMKATAADAPVILVGGGVLLVGETAMPGIASFMRPEHGDVANAIGTALAQVSGEIDRVVSLESGSRQAMIEHALHDARRIAVDAGAVEATLSTVEVDDVPLAYLPGNAVRVRVKVVGDLP